MHAESVLSVLHDTQDLLRSGGDLNKYQNNLLKLGHIVNSTSTSENTRLAISADPTVLPLGIDILKDSFNFKPNSGEEEHFYVRNVRGVVLIVRNLLASSSIQFDHQNLILALNQLISNVTSSNSYYSLCLQAYFQAIANLLTKSTIENRIFFPSLARLIDASIIRYATETEQADLKSPLYLIIDAFLFCYRDEPVILVDRSFIHFSDYIINQGLQQMPTDSFPDELLSALQRCITHPGFKFWLESQHDDGNFEATLNLCQLVISTSDNWSPTELHAIIDWDFQVLTTLMKEAIELLSPDTIPGARLPIIHPQIVRSLDLITTICHQEVVLQFLNDHSALSSFILFLRSVQENTEVKTKKIPQTQPNSEGLVKKNFPMVKSLIIEIVASLCHNSFTNQESMRELHGLELILSNCLIDENNPYVKEYALLCLKYVLFNNQKNQDFVASLEAKQVVNSEALTQAGYEISIEDGNVSVKNSNKSS